MKVLCTGAAGFIGSHIVDACIADGHEVVVIDDLSTGRRENVNSKAKLYILDIRDAQTAEVIREWRPDVLNHHAAQASVVKSAENPAEVVDMNTTATVRLMKAFAEAGGRRFVFASTGGAIYGDSDILPTTEDSPIRPESVYGATKAAAELCLSSMARHNGVELVCLRYGNVYGPRQRPGRGAGVVSIFADSILNGKPVTVYGNGHATRDFVYVQDVVRANMAALRSAEGVYNIGSGVQTPVSEVFNLVAGYCMGVCRKSGVVRHESLRSGEVKRVCLDITKAREQLGWEPQVDFRDGVKEVVEWVRTLG